MRCDALSIGVDGDDAVERKGSIAALGQLLKIELEHLADAKGLGDSQGSVEELAARRMDGDLNAVSAEVMQSDHCLDPANAAADDEHPRPGSALR